MDERDIAQAIEGHGAAAVYRAAHRHSAGDLVQGLARVGLQPASMRDVWAAMCAAFEAMTPAEQAIDYASASSALELPSCRDE